MPENDDLLAKIGQLAGTALCNKSARAICSPTQAKSTGTRPSQPNRAYHRLITHSSYPAIHPRIQAGLPIREVEAVALLRPIGIAR